MSKHVSVLKLLQDFEKLSVFGGVILVDGAIVAFSIAEQLTDEMLLVHAEKALVAYKGVYQMINQQLVLHAPSSIHFVNREEDLGIPSLAKAKQSYHPIRFIRKWMLEN